MVPDFNGILEKAVRSTFRDMAGMEVSNWTSGGTQNLQFSNVFILDSFRPQEMRLQFLFPLEGKKKIVESVLDDDWDNIKSNHIDDCLLEVVNIVGGNFFSRIFQGIPHDIGLPMISFDSRGFSREEQYYFHSEGILFGISLSKE